MTIYEAADIGRAANVKEQWLTHYSPSEMRPQEFQSDLRKIFARTVCARDGRNLTLNFEEEEGTRSEA